MFINVPSSWQPASTSKIFMKHGIGPYIYISSKIFIVQRWARPAKIGLQPWAQTGSILCQGTLKTSSFVRNQILIWRVNNSLAGRSIWEAHWKSLRGAFGCTSDSVHTALPTKFEVRRAGSKHGPWSQPVWSCRPALSLTNYAERLLRAPPDHSLPFPT